MVYQRRLKSHQCGFTPANSLFTASQPFFHDLHTKLSYAIHHVPFWHEITNTNPRHPIQKDQQRNPVLTPKENIKHRKILATRNRRHRRRRNQNPSPKKRNTRRNQTHHPTKAKIPHYILNLSFDICSLIANIYI